MFPLHAVQNPAYVEQLAKAIEARGWQGAPLVVWGDWLVTGVHRYAACQQLAMSDNDIPTVTLDELFEQAGLDLAAIHEEEGSPTITEPAMYYVLMALPEAVRKQYGIDFQP